MARRSINEILDTHGPVTRMRDPQVIPEHLREEIYAMEEALREAREALQRYESHEPRCHEEAVALLNKWGVQEDGK